MDKSGKPLTHLERRIIEAVERQNGAIWGQSPQLVTNHSILCSVSLPYRNQAPRRSFTRVSGTTSLEIQAGKIPSFEGAFQEVGLPYGSRARLLMLHLCSEALKQQSPIIQLERSFTAFARDLGISSSASALRVLKDQSLRLGAASIRISKTNDNEIVSFQGYIFNALNFKLHRANSQMGLFASEIAFNPLFYSSLKTNAVPLSKHAIWALKHSSRALDVYCWLASRLFRIHPEKPVIVRWTSLRFQFGNNRQDMRAFKKLFKTALSQALAVYPDAKVSVIRGGLKLEQSRPAIPLKVKGLIVG